MSKPTIRSGQKWKLFGLLLVTFGSLCASTVAVANSCTFQGDCDPWFYCEQSSGQCLAAECIADSHCPLGVVCLVGKCLTDHDADLDRDGWLNNDDNCPGLANADQADSNEDGIGNVCQ